MRKSVTFFSTISMVVSFVVWSMISPIAPQLTKLYHLSTFDKSVLVATPVLLGSILRIPLGMLTDRYGGRKTYTWLLVYLALPLLGISYAHSFGSLVFWEVLLGVAGTSFAVGIGHVSAWYPPKEQGLVLGVTALGNIGTAVAGFTIPGLYLQFGLPNTARLMIIPVLVMAVLTWAFTRDPEAAKPRRDAASRAAATDSGSKGRFWSSPQLWILSAFYFITFGGFVAFGNYLPTLLQSQFNMLPVAAGLRASGFVILATALRPVGGYLADKMKPLGLLILTFLIITLAAVLFAVGMNSMFLTTLSALVISAMLGIGNGSVFKLVPSYFPHATGKATGIVGAIGGIGGFFPPLVMGAIKQSTGGYSLGMLLLAVAACLALIIAVIQNRMNKKTVPPFRGGDKSSGAFV